MSQSIQTQIDYYLQQDLNALSLSEIRAELREKQFSEEDIREIVAEIDKHKLSAIHNSSKADYQISRRRFGIVLIFIGLALTMSTIVFQLRGIGVYIFAYGPIISGVFLVMFPAKDTGIIEKSRNKGRFKRQL